MTPEELAAIKARYEAATPPPWLPPTPKVKPPGHDDSHCVVDHENCAVWPWYKLADMQFAYAARADVPALVAEIERLQQALDLSLGKAVAYDLDQQGIESRARDAEELVRLRADNAHLLARLSAALEASKTLWEEQQREIGELKARLGAMKSTP